MGTDWPTNTPPRVEGAFGHNAQYWEGALSKMGELSALTYPVIGQQGARLD